MADADLNLRDDVEKHAVDNSSSDRNGSPTSWGNGEKRGSIYDREAQIRHGSITPQHDSFFSAFQPSSFKRNRNARMVTEATDNEGRPLEDQPPAEPALAMKLKQRHLQMIAIGGSIGMSDEHGETNFPAHPKQVPVYSSVPVQLLLREDPLP
jgi:yeast amino acid transporter